METDRLATLYELKAREASLAAEEASLAAALTAARDALTTVRLEISRRHNSAVPVAVLPNELLSHVFEQISFEEQSAPLVVSSVCRHWRKIALHTPWLWTQMMFYDTPSAVSLLRLSMDRSQSCLFTITLHLSGHPSGEQIQTATLNALRPHVWRCRRLVLLDEAKNSDAWSALYPQSYLLAFASGTARHLEFLHLNLGEHDESWNEMPMVLYQHQLPALKTLELNGDVWDFMCTIELPNLERLHIGAEVSFACDSLRSLMLASRQLRELSLTSWAMIAFDDRHRPMELPALSTLTCTTFEETGTRPLGDIVHFIRAPCLTDLRIKFRGFSDVVGFIDDLQDEHGVLRYPSLRKLSLIETQADRPENSTQVDPEFFASLPPTSSLTVLDVAQDSWAILIVPDADLLGTQRTPFRMLWSCLEEVKIQGSSTLLLPAVLTAVYRKMEKAGLTVSQRTLPRLRAVLEREHSMRLLGEAYTIEVL